MEADTELRHAQALAGLEALQTLFESIPPGCEIESQHVAALLALANGALRDLRAPRYLVHMND